MEEITALSDRLIVMSELSVPSFCRKYSKHPVARSTWFLMAFPTCRSWIQISTKTDLAWKEKQYSSPSACSRRTRESKTLFKPCRTFCRDTRMSSIWSQARPILTFSAEKVIAIWKSDGASDLISAVEALQDRRTFFTSRVAELVLNGYLKTSHRHPAETTVARLSPREREVVQLLSQGNITKKVASILNVTVKTAETHRSNVMRKLGIHSITELVLYAVRNNIVQVQLPTPSLADTKSHFGRADLFPQGDHQSFN